MKLESYLGLLLTPMCVAPMATHAADQNIPSNNKKFNIVYILTDDQGYGDLACMGNPYIHTPNIDNLYREGFSFADFHSGTTSAPTRSGLMSGRYCNTVGVWHTVRGRSLLTLEEKTMPELFSQAGYETGMFGKWHLGDYYPYRPHERGFKEAYYHGGGGVTQIPDPWGNDYFDDTYYHNGEQVKTEGYCTDFWFNKAMSFIDQCNDKPFFCYIATNAPHGPLNVEKKYADAYNGNKDITSPRFYGMVTNIDDNIGKLMAFLKEKQLLDNTIVVFMTDNGTAGGANFDKEGNLTKGYNAGMRGKKSSPYEGGHRVPFIVRVPNKQPKVIYSLSAYVDIMPTFLDLCGLSEYIPNDIDGQSLVSKMDNDVETDRYVFADTQRQEFLEKYRLSCVMYKKWRLVNGKELYQVVRDPGQQNDLAKKYPELVSKMQAEYEQWWDKTSIRGNSYERIIIGDELSKKVLLFSHDLHQDNGDVAFSQMQVRQAGNNLGKWALNVKEAGRYRITMYRWHPDCNLKMNDSIKLVPATWGYVDREVAGVAITDWKKAEILVDDVLKKSARVNMNKKNISLTVDLKAGEQFLRADFINPEGKRTSAYYATIEKL